MARMTVHHLEEMAVEVDRVLHHRVVDQRYPHALVASEADRLDDLAEPATVERPHEPLHVAGPVDLQRPRRRARNRLGLEREEIGIDTPLVADIREAEPQLSDRVLPGQRAHAEAAPDLTDRMSVVWGQGGPVR